MWPNPQEAADLVTFTEEILNGKLQFLCSVYSTDSNEKQWTLTFCPNKLECTRHMHKYVWQIISKTTTSHIVNEQCWYLYCVQDHLIISLPNR